MPAEVATPETVTAAEQRIATFLEELGHLGFDAFAQTALSTAGTLEARASSRSEADRVARSVGLDELAADARASVRAHILRTYDEALYRPTMVGLNWGLSEGTVEDRIATVGAAEDAVTAAALEPYLTDPDFQQLTSPFELITRGGAIDASFDMTRATAEAVGGRGPAGWTGGVAIAIVVLVVLIVAFAGLWPIAVIVVIGAAFVARARARSRSRDRSDTPTD
jgi:hypothetical protein